MDISNKLYELRKSKNLSQEEVANLLNVTRQTVSKWETGQSTPDFDKVLPLCELYGISTDELFGVNKTEIKPQEEYISQPHYETEAEKEQQIKNRKFKALGICLGVLLYICSVIWLIVSVAAFNMNPVIAVAGMFGIIAIATAIIIYVSIMYKDDGSYEPKEPSDSEKSTLKTIESIVSLAIVALYFIISFATKAWYITWVLFIILPLINEIIKLIFKLRGNKNEK